MGKELHKLIVATFAFGVALHCRAIFQPGKNAHSAHRATSEAHTANTTAKRGSHAQRKVDVEVIHISVCRHHCLRAVVALLEPLFSALHALFHIYFHSNEYMLAGTKYAPKLSNHIYTPHSGSFRAVCRSSYDGVSPGGHTLSGIVGEIPQCGSAIGINGGNHSALGIGDAQP